MKKKTNQRMLPIEAIERQVARAITAHARDGQSSFNAMLDIVCDILGREEGMRAITTAQRSIVDDMQGEDDALRALSQAHIANMLERWRVKRANAHINTMYARAHQ